jgi:hypothetical protein
MLTAPAQFRHSETSQPLPYSAPVLPLCVSDPGIVLAEAQSNNLIAGCKPIAFNPVGESPVRGLPVDSPAMNLESHFVEEVYHPEVRRFFVALRLRSKPHAAAHSLRIELLIEPIGDSHSQELAAVKTPLMATM